MFRKPDPASSIAPDRSRRPEFSVIGADVVITGNIRSLAALHLEGRVEGDIECVELVQGKTGQIEGAIRAETVRIAGSAEGSVETRALIVESTGRMSGEVTYERLAIAEGGELDGRLITKSTARTPADDDDADGAASEGDQAAGPDDEEDDEDRDDEDIARGWAETEDDQETAP